ncbi:Stp1/IreP family PP2C-type Ser/Thr phosphatase [Exilibacterium tricleocarpae]|uniref:Stp1/IreP family PP2C-type Ser/Thr phosphatase n=1 Tax=Exilibacterium tricleocarpae TaxID=2591008 RepID=A0A545SMG8_9GAMM|nr:Stp1/IreP family PP2C-type Ser/Thr phosphatase [Exilibacterium tricleocarpae]TQV66151.1 Stp1/IreP family PP2C-type Ser/Thr phosphatase [Exilibacterium tricleocarpae]
MENIDPPPYRYHINIEGLTDIGSVRDENEDFFIYHKDDQLPFAYMIVADGMGGYSGGALASRTAAEVIDFELRSLLSPSFAGLTKDRQLQNIRAGIDTSISLANEAILSKKNTAPHLAHMGTTAVLAVIWQDQVFIANVGDSRAYLWRNRQLTRCSKDHSLVQELIDSGAISAAEARQHQHRNQLTRALGVQRAVAADIHQQTLGSSCLLLLCSDGLTEYLDDDTFARELSAGLPAREHCYRLVEYANQQGGKDNITLVIAEYSVSL